MPTQLKQVISSFRTWSAYKSLPCLWPGKSLQVLWCWCSVQFLIASLAKHLGIPRAGSGPSNGIADACLASLSASSLPRMPRCPGTQMRVTSFRLASAKRASRHSATSPEVTFGLLSALSAAWLSRHRDTVRSFNRWLWRLQPTQLFSRLACLLSQGI